MPDDMMQLIGLYEYRPQEPALRDRQPPRRHQAAGRPAARLRPRREERAHAGADSLSQEDPERRRELLHPHLRGLHAAAAGGERQEDPRQPRRPVSLPEAGRRCGHRQQRRDRHPARPRPDRLGDRVRHGDRPPGPLRLGQPGRRLRVRLHGDHRHVRSRRAARQPHLRLVRRQGARDLRAHGAVDRAEGVLRRSDEAPPPAAHASTA